ncbi:MAG: PAS domain S-box protein [Acidobacteria bacterium]|nr:PAS domain S-box protein [Acidobacteriota bacterium]
MKRSSNLKLVLFFASITFVLTALVVFTWERVIRDPFFEWVEQRYPGEANSLTRLNIQQRVEHFTISIAVDVVVVTLLLRLVNRQQRRLVESEERYRALFEHASDGIGVVNAEAHRLTEANNMFCEILGSTAQGLVGRDVREIIRPPGAAAAAAAIPSNGLAELLEGNASGETETVIETADGAARPVSISFKTLTTEREHLIILIMRDLSARRQLEGEREEMQRQLFQTSKLASIGELSAGVAHEINNPLNGVINFAQLLKDEETDRSDFDRQMIDGIIDEGGRIAKIVRGLLAFARHDTHEMHRIGLSEAIKTSLSLFGRQLDKDNITVEVDVPEDLPPLRADGSRLRQVVLNMISNAHYSLRMKQPKGTEGKLFRISARRVESGGRSVVRIEFYDNGVGIPAGNIGKIFDPFFTTRRDVGGTGLGLSISFGIVRDHGGTIRAESEAGQFARFVVEFPADEKEGADG